MVNLVPSRPTVCNRWRAMSRRHAGDVNDRQSQRDFQSVGHDMRGVGAQDNRFGASRL